MARFPLMFGCIFFLPAIMVAQSTSALAGSLQAFKSNRPFFWHPIVATPARAIESERDSSNTTGNPIRIVLQTGITLLFMEEHSTFSQQFFQAGVGLLTRSRWVPEPHLYLSFIHHKYDRHSISAYEWRERRYFQIYPALKFAGFLIVGLGYSFGKETLTLDYHDSYGTSPTTTRSFSISRWLPVLSLDFDIRIYHNWYAAATIFGFGPFPAILGLGVSARM